MTSIPNPVTNTFALEGKSIIVTGAGGGIGAAACFSFAAAGALVTCADINVDSAAKVAERICAAGGAATAIQVDIADLHDSELMAEHSLKTYGHIAGLYANAGISSGYTALEIDESEWNRVIGIDLNGAFFSIKAVLPYLVNQGFGSIVIQSSTCSLSGIPGTAAYSAAKTGLVGLGRQLAVEYAPSGVRINCVSPGVVMTPLLEDLYSKRAEARGTTFDDDLKRTLSKYPTQRLVEEGEVVDLVHFLLSDGSRGMTGLNIPVDGGFTAA